MQVEEKPVLRLAKSEAVESSPPPRPANDSATLYCQRIKHYAGRIRGSQDVDNVKALNDIHVQRAQERLASQALVYQHCPVRFTFSAGVTERASGRTASGGDPGGPRPVRTEECRQAVSNPSCSKRKGKPMTGFDLQD
jgi:hypothetical protein